MNLSNCMLCQSPLVPVPHRHAGVTSDCKPWPRAGTWAICPGCGHVQKMLDEEWYKDIGKIYREYEMYPLSDGQEQVVFEEATPMPRTLRLIENLRSEIPLGAKGRLLDIGCGNGSILRTFHDLYPGWSLCGYEQFDTSRAYIEGLPGVDRFFSGTVGEINDRFDLITIVYVIEHLPDPVGTLKQLKRLLKPDGILFVQTSNYVENPFDLLVVDHCSHFTLETLAYVLQLAGFSPLLRTDSWISKEIGVAGKVSSKVSNDGVSGDIKNRTGESERTLRSMLVWLQTMIDELKERSIHTSVGIFGTAIAGSWLAGASGHCAKFFVDEDPLRHRKEHMGHIVLKPDEVPDNSSVYLAFPPELARKLHARLSRLYPSVDFLVPPEYEPGRTA